VPHMLVEAALVVKQRGPPFEQRTSADKARRLGMLSWAKETGDDSFRPAPHLKRRATVLSREGNHILRAKASQLQA
jgi:hypothetical protein